ncbi:MAG: RecX family transcriptional regulator [Candidatus Woesebacteria bacterium]
MTHLEQLLGRYISLRPRSEYEVRQYLTRKRKKISVSDEFVEGLVAKYKGFGYIDDKKFAESLSHSVIANKSKGKRWLSMKLKIAGVDKETVSAALQAVDPEEIQAAMEKRIAKFEHKWADLDKRTRFAKAYTNLMTAGFSSSEIGPFLDEWVQKR